METMEKTNPMPDTHGLPGDIKETVAHLAKDVWFGNGQPGLTTRMQMVERHMKSLDERAEKNARKWERMELLLWSAVLIALVNLLFTHLK